ncbi:MAG: yhdG 1 [Pseudobdellovibrio sp.]|jgi:amino acid transporter|nr:yhdG 1 [Pseudobdellovibrio sp.]
MESNKAKLSQVLGFGALFIYGVGDILGAGIYAVVGQIAGQAGHLTWASFLVALCIVFLTALCYSELSSRFPKSGGASVYVNEAFDKKWLSILTGWLLFCATVLSMSTLSQAFAGYVATFNHSIPDWILKLVFLLILMFINYRGMKQSSIANIISTAIEVSGLIIILSVGWWYLFVEKQPSVGPQGLEPSLSHIFRGAALAFFAYTGFEDLANIAEEVKSPEKNIPRAILYSLGTAGILYLAVSWTATAVVPWTSLSQTSAPLVQVVEKAQPSFPLAIFSLIAIFAVANTALLNYVTASRLLYGMAEVKLLPDILTKVHKNFHTPHVAIFAILPVVYLTASTSTIGSLASSTSAMVLVVFSLSAAALIRVKLREKKVTGEKNFRIPLFVPCLAVVLNIAAIFFLPADKLIPAGWFVAAGLIFSFVMSRRHFRLRLATEKRH